MQGGWRTLWRGTQPTVVRLGLGAGLHFFILETIKPIFEARRADGSTGMSAAGAMVTGAPGMCRAAGARSDATGCGRGKQARLHMCAPPVQPAVPSGAAAPQRRSHPCVPLRRRAVAHAGSGGGLPLHDRQDAHGVQRRG